MQVAALQQAVAEQLLVPWHERVQRLPAPPAQSTVPEHDDEPQATSHEREVHEIAPEQADGPPHWMLHEAVARQSTVPEQVVSPHVTVQLVPPQAMSPLQLLPAHSMSQLAACRQSTAP